MSYISLQYYTVPKMCPALQEFKDENTYTDYRKYYDM